MSLPEGLVAVVLDTGPLGLVCNPHATAEAESCRDWLASLTEIGVVVAIPEIADYELRRELILADLARRLSRLDKLIDTHNYIPITTAAMRRAAALWSQARKSGLATADRTR